MCARPTHQASLYQLCGLVLLSYIHVQESNLRRIPLLFSFLITTSLSQYFALLLLYSLSLLFCDLSYCIIRMFVSLCLCMRLSFAAKKKKTGNKRVSFEEFLPIFLSCQQKKESGSMEDFIEGLRVFDKDGNGFINSAELRHVLTSLGESTTRHVGCYALCLCTLRLV